MAEGEREKVRTETNAVYERGSVQKYKLLKESVKVSLYVYTNIRFSSTVQKQVAMKLLIMEGAAGHPSAVDTDTETKMAEDTSNNG